MRTFAVWVLVAATASLQAQQPVFRSGVEVVTVPVTVTSRDHSRFIAGLTAADFKVTENGERQDVTIVSRDRLPVSVAVVVDSSPIMAIGNRRQLAEEAVGRLVAGLQPDDEISILFMTRTVEEQLPWTPVGRIKTLNWGGWNPALTTSSEPIGLSPLNDGLQSALLQVERGSNPRRAVVMLSAGFESSSRMSIAALVKNRQQSETAIYGVGLGPLDARTLAAEEPHVRKLPANPNSDQIRSLDLGAPGSLPPQTLPQFDYLETIVGGSGGTVRRVLSVPEAAMAAKSIADELQNQYLVGYTPKKAFDGKYRKLKIEVNQRGVFVRHREGYLAMALTQ